MFKLHVKRTKLLESERQNTDNNEETELTLRKGGGESRPGIAQESITINCDNCFRFALNCWLWNMCIELDARQLGP